MFDYNAEVVRVVDGDTIVLKVDLGFRMTTEQSFRLYGIDTPELRSKDPEERKKAQAAKARLEEMCPVGATVRIQTTKADKYGRWLVRIYNHDKKFVEYVNETMINEGHAKAYYGGKK